jgi:hypothetical protein
VLFNSISGKQLEGMQFKPKMFCDVTRLGELQEEEERIIKENTLKLSSLEVNWCFYIIFNSEILIVSPDKVGDTLVLGQGC